MDLMPLRPALWTWCWVLQLVNKNPFLGKPRKHQFSELGLLPYRCEQQSHLVLIVDARILSSRRLMFRARQVSDPHSETSLIGTPEKSGLFIHLKL